MADKNGLAQVLDKIVEGMGKAKKNVSTDDAANILPKPISQEIGDGVIVWRWMVPGEIVVEAVLATRTDNQSGLEKNEYVVGIQMPDSENDTYALFGDAAKHLGQAVLSAWNWQNIWRLHAGDYLLELLSKEPAQEFSDVAQIVEPEIIEPEILDDYPISNVQG